MTHFLAPLLALLASGAAQAPTRGAELVTPAVICRLEQSPTYQVVCYDRQGNRSWIA